MKKLKKITQFLFILACCALPMRVLAYDPIDLTKTGSIEMTLQYEEKNITDGTLAIYRVADVSRVRRSYEFVLSADFSDSKQSLDNIESPETAENLWQYAKENQIQADNTIVNTTGKVVFEDLKPGLYLIVQTEPSAGYYPLNPFLVSLPMADITTETYQYHVLATGKFEIKPIPDEPDKPDTPPDTPDTPNKPDTPPDTPDTPEGPKLPQTGQLNWPIPVLTVGGMAVFIVGWSVYTKKE